MNVPSPDLSKKESRCVQGSDSFDSFFGNPASDGNGQGFVQTYPAQAVIFKQDTSAHTVYLIERGLVKLVRIAANGRK
jgi:CRP-like cAMP-binding protein